MEKKRAEVQGKLHLYREKQWNKERKWDMTRKQQTLQRTMKKAERVRKKDKDKEQEAEICIKREISI